jgi:GT2 family glycosyltransferase
MKTTNSSQVGIVIVNWNSGEMLRSCLSSMMVCDQLDCLEQVVIVDNNSADDSCENLPSLPVPVRVIRNTENRGFAAACNQGATVCHGKYVLFLNPDSELLPNSLSEPLRFMDEPWNANVAVCGIQLLDESGRVARSCSRLPTCFNLTAMALRLHSVSRRLFPPNFMKEWDHAQTRDVEQVIGAFFFVRRSVYDQLGGFDERFFVYFEEVDFCERTRQLGQRTVFLAAAQAIHVGAGCSGQVRGLSLFYSLRSRLLYANKHFSRAAAFTVQAATLVGEPVIRVTRAALGLKWKQIGPLTFAFRKLWQDRFSRRTALPSNSASTGLKRAA